MFLITTIHIVGYSNLISYIPQSSLNFYAVNALKVMQVFSVSGFTMISAYFLIDSTSTTKKIISFELQLIFYSIALFLVSLLFNRDVPILNIAKSFFPITFNHYWYPGNYLILLSFTPLLNKAIRAFSKAELLKAIVGLAAVAATFFHINPTYDSYIFVGHQTHSLLWFILLYFVAAYIRLYGVQMPRLFGPCMFVACGTILFGLFLIQNGLFDLIGRYPIIDKLLAKVELTSYNSILGLLFTISSFITFCNIKVKLSPIPARIFSFSVPSFFVIYLIQEHNAIREPLWDFVNIIGWAESGWLFPVMIGVFLVLLAGAVLLYAIYRLAHQLLLQNAEKWILCYAEKILQRFSIHK